MLEKKTLKIEIIRRERDDAKGWTDFDIGLCTMYLALKT